MLRLLTLLLALGAAACATPGSSGATPASKGATPGSEGAARSDARPRPEEALLGCWWREQSPPCFLRIEPGKAALWQDGDYRAYRAHFEPGRVIIDKWAKEVAWELAPSPDGSVFTCTTEGLAGEYKKLDHVPPELDPAPLELGAPRALSAELVRAIQDELATRRASDQAVRKDPALDKQAIAVDADNTARIRALVRDVGWIDVDRFGAPASDGAFLIVQHSGDLALMMAALPRIELDVRRKLLDAQAYALLYDRVQVMLGEKQRYGTQLGHAADGTYVVMPLEDRTRVDEFRREIGLFPLKQYLEFLQEHTPMKDVRFAD